MTHPPQVNLADYNNADFDPGAGPVVRTLWFLLNAMFLQCKWIPFSGLRVKLLQLFGATIGPGVVIRPGVNVKAPWNLTVGDHTWIGENVWIDSLTKITIGANCCVSQGAYLCTGNHDWADPAFGLVVKEIELENGVWVGAKAVVLPGVTMKSHSIATAGSVVSKDTEAYGIYRGNPAEHISERVIRGHES